MDGRNRIVAAAIALSTVFTLIIAGLSLGGLTAHADPVTFRVVHYNIYYGKGTDEIYNRERQVQLMLTASPDVIALYEVLPSEANAYKLFLENSSGVTWHSHHVIAQSDGTGNQILSRHPIVSTGSYNMQTNGQYSRGVAQATIDVNGRAINFFSTHLDHNDDIVRGAQVNELKAYLSGFDEPRIVAGDFNAKPDKVEMINFVEDYHDSWEQARAAGAAFAYPDNPVGPNTRTLRDRIDYIFYSKNAANVATQESSIPDQRDLNNTNVVRLLGNSDDLGVRPSDHNMVAAVLTLDPPSEDTTPPEISQVSSAPGSNEAAVSWSTDEASDSQVEYGPAPEYGLMTALNSSLVTGHSMTVTGLSPATTYHYRVRSRDAAGNLSVSGDFVFATSEAPDTSPPVISNVAASNVTATGATITWVTDEPGDSQVEYGTTTSYGATTPLNASLVTTHAVSLEGLSAGTLYHYRVISRDQARNVSVSQDFTFTTTVPPDTTPPVISNVASTGITTNGATISWTTNEPASTQVRYGTTTALGSSSPLDSSMVVSHSVTLGGLSANTLYYYQVVSADVAGNTSVSSTLTFTTSAPADTTAPLISAVASGNLTSTGATITWTTNEASTSQVEYGRTSSFGSLSTLDSTLVTSHRVTLGGLSPDKVYYYRVRSRDAAGNLAVSATFTFKTLKAGGKR